MLLFDGGSVSSNTKENADADADVKDDEPKLCPEPGPAQPGSEYASDRAKAYQEQISLMVNPQRPLEYGLALNLENPFTGKVVHYDECDEKTGTMIEAKGPGFDGLLSFPNGYNNVTEGWIDQGTRELQAAGTRQVIWYFAEDTAAEYARIVFEDNDLGKIIVRVQHPE